VVAIPATTVENPATSRAIAPRVAAADVEVAVAVVAIPATTVENPATSRAIAPRVAAAVAAAAAAAVPETATTAASRGTCHVIVRLAVAAAAPAPAVTASEGSARPLRRRRTEARVERTRVESWRTKSPDGDFALFSASFPILHTIHRTRTRVTVGPNALHTWIHCRVEILRPNFLSLVSRTLSSLASCGSPVAKL